MDELARLAGLLRERNVVDAAIAGIIQRPAHVGHIGEYIAKAIFGVELAASATHKGSDGIFRSGGLAGKSVNVKFYPVHTGLLDMHPQAHPDYYLVLAGPKGAAVSSVGKTSSLLIHSVFLFESLALLKTLEERGVKIGIATSVIKRLWDEAEVYPAPRATTFILTDEQSRLLALFR